MAANGTYEWPVHRAAFPRKRAGPGIRPPPAPQPFPRSSPHTTEAAGHGTPPGSPRAHDGPGRPAHRPSCGVSRRSRPGRWRREAPPAKRWPRSAPGAHEGSEPAPAGQHGGPGAGPAPVVNRVPARQANPSVSRNAPDPRTRKQRRHSGAPLHTERCTGPHGLLPIGRPRWLPLLPRSGRAAPVDGTAQCRIPSGSIYQPSLGQPPRFSHHCLILLPYSAGREDDELLVAPVIAT